jgi:putative beta-lysine N-acetyltransferase
MEIAALMLTAFDEYASEISAEAVAGNISDGRSIFRAVSDREGVLVAVASAEIDRVHGAAELTDCVVACEHRGRGMMRHLLRALEGDAVSVCNIEDVYSLARAGIAGMNCDLAMLGFEYTGRLINNCRMPTGWESMNIWCRRASRPPIPQ